MLVILSLLIMLGGVPLNSANVMVTAYTSSVSETDFSPWVAAWNNRLHHGDRVIAVSRDLEKLGLGNGSVVYVEGLGLYTVRDRMNKRKRRSIDIWFETNKRAAIKFGKKRLRVYWISGLKKS